ncbi:recombinase family protein [Anaerobacillus sp. HL2]|nr:recombinase family protein [Anaerobacillus sp. HL2]
MKEKEWIVVEEEAKIVREAFDEFLNGKTLAQICKQFIGKYRKPTDERIGRHQH